MKRDFLIALIVIVVIGAICYGLALSRPALSPTRSQPFSTASIGPNPGRDRIVMRINGEPVTETEFEAGFNQLPPDVQERYSSDLGKMAFAEQYIRLKLLEQQARSRGLDRDPKITGQLAAGRANVLANAAADALVGPPTDQNIRKFYSENKQLFETVDLSHIVFAYRGGRIPPRKGGSAASQREAMQRSAAVYQRLKSGTDFAATARDISDDSVTAARGGELGIVPHGALPPDLETRLFKLQAGQITEPIPSAFGIHIFKVNWRGMRPLDQVRQDIAQRVRTQSMSDRIEVLRGNAKVDFDPRFFPAAKTWPGNKKPSKPS